MHRLSHYPLGEVLVEIALIWIFVFAAARFVQGTRAAGALKSIFVIVVIATIVSRVAADSESFQRLRFLYDRFLALFAIGLIVIFQPELRRALVRLGEAPFLRGTPKDIGFVADAVTDAASYLSRAKFGAIIVIERTIGLAGLVEGGTTLRAELSARLLQTIFFPGSALHDLAVIIKGKTVEAAGVQLPMAEAAEMPDPRYGARHRAALGLTKECDALVVVVSEETGRIRIAERGRLSEAYDAEELRAQLRARLARERTANSMTPSETRGPESAQPKAGASADPPAPAPGLREPDAAHETRDVA